MRKRLLYAFICVLGFLTLVGLVPQVVHAQPKIIEISSEYVFEERLEIRVLITSDEIIQQGMVFLRVPETGAVIYGEMQVVNETDEGILLAYVLDLELEPLPPFSVIEYWTDISLESGEKLTTEKNLLVYTDNQRDWQVIEEAPLRVLWYEGDVAHALEVMSTATQGLDDIYSLVAIRPVDPIEIFVYPDAGTLADSFGSDGGFLPAGHANPEASLILAALPDSPDAERLMAQRVPHELMHILLYQNTGEGYRKLPLWLQEGLAAMVEGYANPDYEVLVLNAYESGELLPLGSLCQGFPQDQGEALLAYAQSSSFTRYLYQRFGSSGIEALVAEYADGKNCQFGAQDALGYNLSDLEAEWRRDTFGEVPPGSGFSNLMPWVILLGLTLAVPLLLTLWFVRKQR